MSIPEYIKTITISVKTSCSRKGDFKIEGKNATRILEHLDDKPVVFSTEKDGYKISITLVPKNNEIIGMIKIPKPADELCSDVSSNICCEIVGEKLQKAPLCVHFYDTVLEFTLNCPYAQEVQKKTWLCLDLGNTRTCALLDLPDEEIEFYDVRFLSRNPEENKGVDPKVPVSEGIIESLCATIDPSDGRHSFTVFGKEALWYNNTIDRNSGCKVMFSSPKRYFWDDKRDNRIVKAKGDSKSKSKSFKNKEKSDFEKKLLGETDHCSPMHVFQSSIIELLEQAEATLKLKEKILDNKTEMEKSDILEDLKDLDYVTNLVFACPAAWTVHERAVYSEVVRKACEIYNTRAIAGCRKFKAELSCDEATAVLMYYVKQKLESGEQDGNNMASWIYRNGKPGDDKLGSKMRCRIGVIDVGGGTSDLSIAEMRINKVNDFERVNVESLYSNGTHDAGDKLLRNIIRKILFDRVFDSLFTQDGLEFFMKEKDHAAKQYLQEKLKALVQTQKFTRSFWFQLAIKAVECMGKNIELKQGELLNVYDEILMAFREDVAKDDDIKKTGFECAWIKDAAELTISLEDLQKEYKEVIEETFSATASLFGSALLVYDCDLLLFSGKTMEIKPVREFFNKYLSIPVASLEGHDLKKATAIGAEYFVRKNDVEMNLGIEVTNYKSNEDEQFYWLVKSNRGEKSFTRDECITLDNCNQSEIFIYREKFKGNRDFRTPSYKLKLKDCQGHKNSDLYTVKLQYDQNDKDKKLQIQSIKGPNSEEECKDKWELSICMFGNADEQSWLDTGKIFE